MSGLLIMSSIGVAEGEVALVGLCMTQANFTFMIDLPNLLSHANKLSLASLRVKTGLCRQMCMLCVCLLGHICVCLFELQVIWSIAESSMAMRMSINTTLKSSLI